MKCLMDRSTSSSFQPVEDWLRNLGLLHYAQSFYDNGYEDIETCKLIGEADLVVIGITSVKDKNDIISAVLRLKQNIYFELELEAGQPEVEHQKYDPTTLKSKLKDCLKSHNVQLIEPPYYNPDGTFGDLYPLAIKFSEELSTDFNDVLEALELLRKRQLPIQSYDQVNQALVEKNNVQKRRSMTVADPAEYLNCETSANSLQRSFSISKYDTRVTKSTTDLTKGLLQNSQQKGIKKIDRNKSIFGVFKRKELSKSVRDSSKAYDFKASDVVMSSNEIVDLIAKVKNHEISQDDAVAAVKKSGLSKSNSVGASKDLQQIPAYDAAKPNRALSRKEKLSKSMIKRNVPSSQFYTDEQHQDVTDCSPENLRTSRTSENDSSLSDVESGLSCSASSPELGKAGIFSAIRNSLRKKGKVTESSPEKGDSTTEQGRFYTYPTDVRSHSLKENKLPSPTPSPKDSRRKASVASVGKKLPSPTPSPKDSRRNASVASVGKSPMNKPSSTENDKFIENSFRLPQESKAELRNDFNLNLKPATTTTISNVTHQKPLPPPRVPKGNGKIGVPKPPPRPPTKSSSSSEIEAQDDIEPSSMDAIGMEMKKLVAELDQLHKNPVKSKTAENNDKLLFESSKKGLHSETVRQFNIEKGSRTKKQEVLRGKMEYTKQHRLMDTVKQKLNGESIVLNSPPYTTKDGKWCIPLTLVERYAKELKESVTDISYVFEKIRVT